MKVRKPRAAPSPEPPRKLNLDARFTPEGPDAADLIVFSSFCRAAEEQILKLRRARLLQQKADFAKFSAAQRKTQPVFLKVLRNEIPPEVAAKELKKLVPDKAILGKLFEFWKSATERTPEKAAAAKEEAARQSSELAKCETRSKAQNAVSAGLERLAEAVQEGDAEATNALVEAAIHAVGLVGIMAKVQSELFRPVARNQTVWPVLANDDPGWAEKAAKQIAGLELGAELQVWQARFRQARGADANLPARLWAKAAVRTLEQTRLRYLFFAKLARDFGSAKAFAQFWVQTGWETNSIPSWAENITDLGEFSAESLPKWKRAVREMIREQVPDLHSRPEWSTQRNSAEARGRGTPGEIRCAILDDICSALDRIATRKEMPTSTC